MSEFFASLVAAPIAYAALQGEATEPLIQATGLSPEVLADPDARVSYDAVIGLWTHLVHEVFVGEPLGIRYGQWLGLSRLGAFGLLSQHSPSLRVWFERFRRLQHILDPKLRLEIHEFEDREVLTLDNGSFALELIEPMEMFMVMAHDSVHELFSGQVQPVVLTMAHAQRHHDEVYAQAFSCPVIFDAPDYSMTFDVGVLDRLVDGAQAPIGHYVAKYLESLNVPLPQKPQVDHVEEHVLAWIEDNLPDGPTHQGAADALGMSVRTLQRKLRARGETFSALLSRARRARALHYLKHSSLPIAEIAFLVGYGERASFYRAFRSWTGKTPEYMRRAR